MKTTLSHLPENKQAELQAIGNVFEEHDEVQIAVLFGSYARGNWVEDEYEEDGIRYTYQSDFDILVITRTTKQAENHRLQKSIKQKLGLEIIGTPISLIYHSIDFVNRKLDKGQYFFTDIRKEGIELYSTGKYQLNAEKELSAEDRRLKAEEDFEYWFVSANGYLKHYSYALNDADLNIAAFNLHQATERYYSAILLVFNSYKPKSHDIERLGRMAANLDKRFFQVFPRATDEEDERFVKLQKAYIDARYTKDYSISKVELELLAASVNSLKELTEIVCTERIAEV
jgi:predicted nucleotidyltransferase/HEPN domain-containing protein